MCEFERFGDVVVSYITKFVTTCCPLTNIDFLVCFLKKRERYYEILYIYIQKLYTDM